MILDRTPIPDRSGPRRCRWRPGHSRPQQRAVATEPPQAPDPGLPRARLGVRRVEDAPRRPRRHHRVGGRSGGHDPGRVQHLAGAAVPPPGADARPRRAVHGHRRARPGRLPPREGLGAGVDRRLGLVRRLPRAVAAAVAGPGRGRPHRAPGPAALAGADRGRRSADQPRRPGPAAADGGRPGPRLAAGVRPRPDRRSAARPSGQRARLPPPPSSTRSRPGSAAPTARGSTPTSRWSGSWSSGSRACRPRCATRRPCPRPTTTTTPRSRPTWTSSHRPSRAIWSASCRCRWATCRPRTSAGTTSPATCTTTSPTRCTPTPSRSRR